MSDSEEESFEGDDSVGGSLEDSASASSSSDDDSGSASSEEVGVSRTSNREGGSQSANRLPLHVATPARMDIEHCRSLKIVSWRDMFTSSDNPPDEGRNLGPKIFSGLTSRDALTSQLVGLHLPTHWDYACSSDGVTIGNCPKGWMGVYVESVQFGMIFPLANWLKEFIHRTGVTVSRLSPSFWAQATAFTLACELVGTTPTLRLFCYVFTFLHLPNSLTLLKNRAIKGFIRKSPKLTPWCRDFFFVRPPPDEWVTDDSKPLPTGWALGRSLERPELTSDEQRIIAAIGKLPSWELWDERICLALVGAVFDNSMVSRRMLFPAVTASRGTEGDSRHSPAPKVSAAAGTSLHEAPRASSGAAPPTNVSPSHHGTKRRASDVQAERATRARVGSKSVVIPADARQSKQAAVSALHSIVSALSDEEEIIPASEVDGSVADACLLLLDRADKLILQHTEEREARRKISQTADAYRKEIDELKKALEACETKQKDMETRHAEEASAARDFLENEREGWRLNLENAVKEAKATALKRCRNMIDKLYRGIPAVFRELYPEDRWEPAFTRKLSAFVKTEGKSLASEDGTYDALDVDGVAIKDYFPTGRDGKLLLSLRLD
ncbi:unnamed protein product [Linum tenue]|uniref:Uncharacterized protein n=1 Tax=Linum tenue TaxID=586396 RepID=A0AAV0HUJ6_9ROSI|nr:unnamed protein product [Linum tenue]